MALIFARCCSRCSSASSSRSSRAAISISRSRRCGAPLKTMVRKALQRERMYDGLARRSKERPIVEVLAHLTADKRAGDESFRDRDELEKLAKAIVGELKPLNL